MKQLQKTTKKIGDCTFYLTPFPAFVAANISGELASILLPLIGSLVPIAANAMQNSNAENFMDTKLEDVNMDVAIPALSKALSGFTGNQLELFLKKILVEYKNVSVESKKMDIELQIMDMDLANEIFCGCLDEMYMLCIEVLKLNFGGFFKKLGTRFGEQISAQMTATSTVNTASLM